MTRAVSAEERDRIVEMLGNDVPPFQIAQSTGRSVDTVKRLASANGIKLNRKCQCGRHIGPRNSSGICTVCHSRAPEGRARRSATMTELSPKLWADPGTRGKMTAAAKERVHRTVLSPAARVNSNAPEARAKAVASKRAKDMAWCPQSMWETYRYLTQVQGVRMVEAKRMVLEMHEAEGRRIVRRIAEEQRIRHEREKAQAW